MEESFSREKGGAREDMISKLPDSLISQILLHLPTTKEAVRTSVLSQRWKSLWLLIPGLDLDSWKFPNFSAFVGFVDRFLDVAREEKSCLHKFKLGITKDIENDPPCVTRWIDFVVRGKLEHLDVECTVNRKFMEEMPLSLYICETLLHLKLHRVSLGKFESISLPRLGTIWFEENIYANDAALESLISSCPVLQDLSILRTIMVDDNVKVLRVHSQTLTTFNIYRDYFGDENLEVLIDAPKLKYLDFQYDISRCKIISNSDSLVKVSFGRLYDGNGVDLQKIRNFVTSISGVSDMKISYKDFKYVGKNMPLPQFCNLTSLEVGLYIISIEMLPRFLESCPNLKSLVLNLYYGSGEPPIRLSSVPECLLSSLEFVKIINFFYGGLEEPFEKELVRYFLENSVILKKLVLRSGSSNDILEQILAFPRRSTTCQVVYVPAQRGR